MPATLTSKFGDTLLAKTAEERHQKLPAWPTETWPHLLHVRLALAVVAAVWVEGQALLGQVGVVRHQEAPLRAHVGAGHVVGGHRAGVVIGVHPPAQKVPVLQRGWEAGWAQGGVQSWRMT